MIILKIDLLKLNLVLVFKLWADYNVTQEYKLVDNEKLGEPNFDYLQFGS